MKSNKVKQNYPKYKKVSTNIKGDLLLDDSFLSNRSKDDSLSTDAVSSFTKNQFVTYSLFLLADILRTELMV